MKVCTKCRTAKPATAEFFYAASWIQCGLRPDCKACCRERAKRQYHDDPMMNRRHKLRRNYGITPEDYDRMLEDQGGRCAICRSDDPQDQWGTWNIDHSHATNQVRGLLCVPCNQGVGHFYDDPDRIEAAARYLRSSTGAT